jgi:hypothetical protein
MCMRQWVKAAYLPIQELRHLLDDRVLVVQAVKSNMGNGSILTRHLRCGAPIFRSDSSEHQMRAGLGKIATDCL